MNALLTRILDTLLGPPCTWCHTRHGQVGSLEWETHQVLDHAGDWPWM